MNIILKPFNCCPECLNTTLITDFNRLEVYCSYCGLVVKDTSYLTPKEVINSEEKAKQKLEKLKKVKELEPIIKHYQKQQFMPIEEIKISWNFFSFKKNLEKRTDS